MLRTIDRLAADVTAVLAAIDTARAAARARAWKLARAHAPDHDTDTDTDTDTANPPVIDVDPALVTAHSDKEGAAATLKKGFGHHPCGRSSITDPPAPVSPSPRLLRPGNAGSNTATDHITAIHAALRQLPDHKPGNRAGRKVLIRIDGAGASHELMDWLAGQRTSYSVGSGRTQALVDQLDQLVALPASRWQPAYTADGKLWPGAWVIEATGLMNLATGPVDDADAGDCRPRTATPGCPAAPDRP